MAVGAPSASTASLMAVRILSQPTPKFSKRPRRASRTCEEPTSTKMPLDEPTSGKVYLVDRLRLHQAVCLLEGPDEVGSCLLLKLLMPSPTGWAESYRGLSGGTAEKSQRAVHRSIVDSESQHPGWAEPSCSPCPYPRASMVSNVELSCNGDDFDNAGFEAVMEYLSTGQVRFSHNYRRKKVKL